MVKWTLKSAPSLIIGVFVGILILSSVASALWTSILDEFTTVGALGNFTFSAMVGATSTSLTVILLSVALLAAIMGALGYSIYGSSKR